MKKDIEYPDETWGSKVAREIRVECNRLSKRDRRRLQRWAERFLEKENYQYYVKN